MGKLNIAHHKSYHPYRRDNIERVRRDEEAERLKEEQEEGRIRLADSEARISLLRERAGLANTSSKSRKKLDDEKERAFLEQAVSNPSSAVASTPEPSGASASLTTDGKGHINLFGDLESATVTAALTASSKLAKASKDSKEKEDEKGIPLAPSKKDLKPWYSEREMDPEKGRDEDRRNRDSSHKSLSDPLTSINRQLAVRFPPTPTTSASGPQRREWGRPPPPPSRPSSAAATETETDPARTARLSRESSERQRALALIARRKREAAGSATPSTISGSSRSRYGDQFNARDVEEAHRDRERQDRRERDRRRYSERRWEDA